MIKRAPRSDAFAIFNLDTVNLKIAPELLGVYLHLLSKPDHWAVNGAYLINHFGISKNKAYRILNDLCATKIDGVSLMTKNSYRNDQGRMATDYTINEPSPQKGERSSPQNGYRSSPQNGERNQSLIRGAVQSSKTGPVNEDLVSIELVKNIKGSDEWMPDAQTLTACRISGIKPDDEMIATFRLKILDWQDKDYRGVNLRSKFISHCKEMKHAKASRPDSARDLEERINDTAWAD